MAQIEIVNPWLHSHQNKTSILLCRRNCRAFIGGLESAEAGRLRRMQSSGSWLSAVCREEHPAGVIKELLPDLLQDQGPKHIYLFNSCIFEELHTKDFQNACSGAGGRRPQALALKVLATESQQLLGPAAAVMLQSWGLAAQLLASA